MTDTTCRVVVYGEGDQVLYDRTFTEERDIFYAGLPGVAHRLQSLDYWKHHADRDDGMGWLVRYSFSDAEGALHAREVVRYVDRLRDEINWRREIHAADVAELKPPSGEVSW